MEKRQIETNRIKSVYGGLVHRKLGLRDEDIDPAHVAADALVRIATTLERAFAGGWAGGTTA